MMMRRIPIVWIPIFDLDTRRLLFKYDPNRRVVEIQYRGKLRVIDLDKLEREYHERSNLHIPLDTQVEDGID
jgi:hypothetical protein